MEELQEKYQQKAKKRSSNFELLRIIAMLMIAFHHFAVHGGFSFSSVDLSLSRFWINFISMGGKIGVDIYVLISGYFLIVEKENFFNIKQLLKMWCQIAFYSVVITLIFAIYNDNIIGIGSFIKMLFPITFSRWWFASTYFVLYLLHPFLNRLLLNLEKAAYQRCLLLLIICWSIIPTFTTSSYQSNSLLWFITLYSVAAYIRLYGLNQKLERKHYAIFGGVFSALTYASSVVFDILGTRWSVFSSHDRYFFGQEKLSVFVISLSLFMIFEKTSLGYNKWINLIASTTFGVYLIHDNDFIRPFLWADVFKNAEWQTSSLLIPYSVAVVIIVFVCCAFIDLGRKYLFEKPALKIIDANADKWLLPFTRVTSIAKNIVFGKGEL